MRGANQKAGKLGGAVRQAARRQNADWLGRCCAAECNSVPDRADTTPGNVLPAGVTVFATLPPGRMADREQPVLLGDEMRLRPWQLQDARDLRTALADPAIQRWHARTIDSDDVSGQNPPEDHVGAGRGRHAAAVARGARRPRTSARLTAG